MRQSIAAVSVLLMFCFSSAAASYRAPAEPEWTAERPGTIPFQRETTGSCTDGEGNIYVLSQRSYPGWGQPTVTKFSPTGTTVWDRTWMPFPFDTDDDDGPTVSRLASRAICVDTTGGVYVAGTAVLYQDSLGSDVPGSPAPWVYDIGVTKLSAADGSTLWTKHWGAPGFTYDSASSVAADADGRVYVAGVTYGSFDSRTNSGGADFFVSVLDSDGNRLWSEILGSTGDESGNVQLALDTGTNIYVCGESGGAIDGIPAGAGEAWLGRRLCLFKFGADGSDVWRTAVGEDPSMCEEGIQSIATDGSSAVFVLGWTYPISDNNPRATGWVQRYGSDGGLVWTHTWSRGRNSPDSSDHEDVFAAMSIACSPDGSGGVCITGNLQPAGTNSRSFCIKEICRHGNELWERKWHETTKPGMPILLKGDSDRISGMCRAEFVTTFAPDSIYVAGIGDRDGDGEVSSTVFLTKWRIIPDWCGLRFGSATVRRGGWALAGIQMDSMPGGGYSFADLVGDQLPRGSIGAVWNSKTRRYTIERYGRKGWPTGDDAVRIRRGEAFWLHASGRGRPKKSSYEVEWCGASPTAATTTIDIYSGWNQVTYPYPRSMEWQETQLARISPNGSTVLIWDTARQRYAFSRKTGGEWRGVEGLTIARDCGVLYRPAPMPSKTRKWRPRSRKHGRPKREPVLQWIERKPCPCGQ